MALLVTDALVLHAFDYLESSRILRLATREAGVVSVLAKGARRSRSRYGSALDLFAEGSAQMYVKPGRDLHTLSAFEVARSRPAIAEDLGRFTGAAAIAELVLRFANEEASPVLYDTVLAALDGLAAAPPLGAREAALRGAWRLVTELGFAPSLDLCSRCHTPVERSGPAMFSHPAGGLVCTRCARLEPAGRVLPDGAREALAAWLAGGPASGVDEATGRAHQRLLREFLREHLSDGRPLRAFEVWEHERWS
ncbi:MAG TPA: DNA repair protein RecO [Gemmatimonadaceae bacterium]